MTFTLSHDHVGLTVTPEDLDATIEWYSENLIGQRIAFVTDNLGTIIELAEPGTWPRGGRAHA